MEITFTNVAGTVVAEAAADGVALATAQDALDLIGEALGGGARCVILEGRCLAPRFFDLSTGLAGEVLQKFVNYGVRVAIVGDVESGGSASLRAFVAESNRGRHVAFVPDRASALQRLRG